MSKERRISDEDAELIGMIMQFRKQHGELPFQTGEVAAWALRKKLWKPRHRSLYRELKKELSRVAKKAREKDPQDRSVRSMHAAKVMYALADGTLKQKVIWDYIYTMSLDHAQASFSQRYDQLAGGSCKLQRDLDSFNENNPNAKGHKIQMSFNFELVIEEEEQKTYEIQADVIRRVSTARQPPSGRSQNAS